MFETDDGGYTLQIDDAKIAFGNNSTWAIRLSQLANIKGNVYIMTYSLPDLPYVQELLGKRPHDIYIVAHSKFLEKAVCIKETYPDIHIALRDDTHAKVVLTGPNTVWLSSANFGKSGWLENTIGIHSQKAFEYYKFAFKSTFDSSAQIGERITLMNEIEPCPICGKNCSEYDTVFSDVGIYIECPSCSTRGWPEKTTDEAMNTWNARNKSFATPDGIIKITEKEAECA